MENRNAKRERKGLTAAHSPSFFSVFFTSSNANVRIHFAAYIFALRGTGSEARALFYRPVLSVSTFTLRQAQGERLSDWFLTSCIPFVVRLSNHERSYDTGSEGRVGKFSLT